MSAALEKMVAVKTLWVLWKNFSNNFSFSNSNGNNNNTNNNHSSDKNGNKDTKRVKYNRLRAFEKSESTYFPKSLSRTNFNCLTKSSSTGFGDSNGSNATTSSSVMNSSWNKSTLEDSDSEYEENDDYYMSTTPDDFSDFEDEDEALTCDVCDRSFPTAKRLTDHQQKKRHFGCLQCDSIFPSKQALDHHRQEMDHYDFVYDYESETTSFESDDENGLESSSHHQNHHHTKSGNHGQEEERERLL